jgi:hypothetical protein
MEYKDYLKSNHWKNKKNQHYRKASSRRVCFVCGEADNLHVHHNTYENINNEKLQDLVTLCQKHHHELHEVSKNFKIDYRYTLKILYTAFKYKETDYSEVMRKLYNNEYSKPSEELKRHKEAHMRGWMKRKKAFENKYTWKCDNPALS